MPPFLHRGSPNQTVFGVPALPTNESNKTDRRFLVALSVAVTKNEVCPNAEVSRIQATTSFSIGNFLLLQNTAADLKRFSRRRNENFSFKVGSDCVHSAWRSNVTVTQAQYLGLIAAVSHRW